MPTKSVQNLAAVVEARLKQSGSPSPGKKLLNRLFEVIFFSTLKTEEGKPLQLRVLLVNPNDPDPEKPPKPRPDRWKITKLTTRLPCTVPTLTKLSRAADPWNSSLAVYYDDRGELFIWALVDQTVHFNTMLVRENTTGAYPPPGLFQVLASGPADLSVHSGFKFIARLTQDTLLKTQTDVFWSGPVMKCIDKGMQPYLAAVWKKIPEVLPKDQPEWNSILADRWMSTLCRILISIQRYRHGGAFLITKGQAQLNVKYGVKYNRLPSALRRCGVADIKQSFFLEEINSEYVENFDIDTIPTLLYLDQSIAESDREDYKNEITGCVRFISSLSCVDGLILATPDLAVRGFGVEILTKKEPSIVFLSNHPSARKSSLRRIAPQDYGTRHRTMMRYCFAHPGSLGFVISQDGEIRVMTKINNSLVMWENLQVLDYVEIERKKKIPTEEDLVKSAIP